MLAGVNMAIANNFLYSAINTESASADIGFQVLKAFDLMVKKFQINPRETLYIEDIAKNLSIGKERGAITVWLINEEYWGKKESEKEYIDYKIENLSLFLKEIRLLKNT